MKRFLLIPFFLLLFVAGLFAQLGIQAGVNMANEIRSLSQEDITAGFKSENLTGYHIGLVYQVPFSSNESGFSTEVGALLSQKGSFFRYYEDDLQETIVEAYNELNYIEVPVSIRYTLSFGILGIYGYAGVYGGYLLDGKTVNEKEDEVLNMTFSRFMDKLDYGYTLGAGIELLKKIQIGASWAQGIKTNPISVQRTSSTISNSKNNTFSVNLTYLF